MPDQKNRVLPRIPQGTLADLSSTTRSHVNFLMSTFMKIGIIDYNGDLKVINPPS